MIQEQYFKSIMDNLSTAILLAEPLYNDDEKITDFQICYMNESFLRLSKDFLKENECFSIFKPYSCLVRNGGRNTAEQNNPHRYDLFLQFFKVASDYDELRNGKLYCSNLFRCFKGKRI